MKGSKHSKRMAASKEAVEVKSESDSEIESRVGKAENVTIKSESESDSEVSDIDSELDEKDEFDEDEMRDASQSDNDDATTENQTRKRTPQESFATAMDAIFGSKIKAHDRENPVLIRSRKKAKVITEAKLEYNARKALAQEKKEFLEKAHDRQVLPTGANARQVLEQERVLRKTAQRGVVQLFNAIMKAQGQAATAASAAGATTGTTDRVKQKVNEMTKDSFLDAIRMG